MIRAPDEYIYPAPFNLIEFLLIAPLEYVLLVLVQSIAHHPYRYVVSKKTYARVCPNCLLPA